MLRLAFVRAIEDAAISSWPALSTVIDGRWVTRISEGHTGRANSVNILDPGDSGDAALRLDRAAELFRRRNIRPTLRVTPLTPPQAIGAAEAEGWRPEGESLLMTLWLDPKIGRDAAVGPHTDRVTSEWLDAVATCMEFSPAKRGAIGRKLEVLGLEAGFFFRRDDDGQAVATGLGVLSRPRQLLGIMDLGVDPRARRLGHGSAILREILVWGSVRLPGAGRVWLQVSADNLPAIALYQQHGFAEYYRYHYLREPAPHGASA